MTDKISWITTIDEDGVLNVPDEVIDKCDWRIDDLIEYYVEEIEDETCLTIINITSNQRKQDGTQSEIN
jgi:hypothetical protein